MSASPSPLDAAWTGFSADLLALRHHGDGRGGSFDLKAASVVVEVDSVRMVEASETGFYTRGARTETDRFGASTWRFDTTGGNSSLYVAATKATLAADVGASRISMPDDACLPQPWYFQSPRVPACVPLDGAALATSSSPQWRIEGDFLLVLWAWEGAAEGQAGSRVWSGARPTQANALDHGEFELRQVFMTVTNGTLDLRPSGALPVTAAVSVVGFDATSMDEGAQDEAGTPVTIARDGKDLVTTTAAVGPDGRRLDGLWPAAMAAGALLALAPFTAGALRRRASLRRLELCQRNLRLGNFNAAARHAWRVRHASVAVEGAVLGAVASLRARSVASAQAFLERLHGLDRHDEATCAYLRAQLLVLQGRTADAERALEACLDLDPTFGTEAAANPALAPFLDPRRWPAGGA